jgi:hypothetical protein
LQVFSMNKVFKSVWSEALGAWVAASELCRGRGKGGGQMARAVALVVGLTGAAGGAFAGTGLALGTGSDAAKATDIAFGPGAIAASKNQDALAIGDTAKALNDYSIAFGSFVTNNAANAIVMGANAGMDANSKGTVFFGTKGGMSLHLQIRLHSTHMVAIRHRDQATPSTLWARSQGRHLALRSAPDRTYLRLRA